MAPSLPTTRASETEDRCAANGGRDRETERRLAEGGEGANPHRGERLSAVSSRHLIGHGPYRIDCGDLHHRSYTAARASFRRGARRAEALVAARGQSAGNRAPEPLARTARRGGTDAHRTAHGIGEPGRTRYSAECRRLS